MLTSLIHRTSKRGKWQKIPWDDPDFSQRMLREHLAQSHDHASRRFDVIERQVAWIQHKCLNGQAARILDLGCGPGLYTSRLATLGHACTGIDFGPASIAYAVEHDDKSTYIQGDLCQTEFGEGYDLVMLIFGELNAFSPEDARQIIEKAYHALEAGGRLLLEVSTFESIYRMGNKEPLWYTTNKGLFGDEPYLCLTENRYDMDCAIEDIYVFFGESNTAQHFMTMHQAYTDDEYRCLLDKFKDVRFFPSLTGGIDTGDFYAIIAEK